MTDGAGPVTRAAAREGALAALEATGEPGQMTIVDAETVEYEFGWVFRPHTLKFLETGDPAHEIPGVGGIAVDRDTGKVTFLPTYMPPDRAIFQHNEAWRAGRGRR